MTNVVKRGTNRPAHYAKVNRHSQRNVVVGGKRDDALKGALRKETPTMAKEPKPRFVVLGKKYVHVVHDEAYDLKNTKCQTVKKAAGAGKIPAGSLSAEAALALDGCPKCATAIVAERQLPASSKREDAKEKRDDVLKRAKGESLSDRAKKGRKVVDKKSPSAPAARTKSGTRSTVSGTDDPAKAKAQLLVDFAVVNGWEASLGKDNDTGHWVVHTFRGNLKITAWYIDGKYDINRHAVLESGNWKGTLRGAHAARRQMDASLDDRDRPHPQPGRGRSGPRKKVEDELPPDDESPEDAARRVPFLIDDDEATILDAIQGKVIKWRNGVNNSIQQAWLPAGPGNGKRPRIAIVDHPKNGRRMVEFFEVAALGEHGEVYGPERSVRLDRIVRVVG